MQCKNINLLPFRARDGSEQEPKPPIRLTWNYLSMLLGSTHSQLIAIFEITLFTSAEKGFHFSNYYYYQDLYHEFFESGSHQTF